ncbi:MAG TPA: tetratricopeptide repeat protein [Verrucomicrobiae bacterium]|nr:tetratricopeptide repeat protein [Verrucomicrobiae bacterium]
MPRPHPIGPMIAAGFLILGIASTFFWAKPVPIALPEIPFDQLETNIARVIRIPALRVLVNPESGSAWGELGTVLKAFGLREPSRRCLAEAEQLEPKEPRWPYLQGVLQNVGSASIAEAKLRRAVALCGNDPEMPRLRLARLLAEAGRTEDAQQQLQELLRTKPNSGPARVLMAGISQARGEWNEAIAYASGSTTNPYTARTAWTLLATSQRRRGDTNAAELAYRRATAVTPDAPWPDPFEDEVVAWRNDVRSLNERAQGYLMAGRVAEAIPVVNRLMRDHPNFPETWLLLGRLRNLQNQPQPAEAALRRFLQAQPESVNGQFQLGMSLLQQKRYPEAAVVFQYATTLKRDFGVAFFNLGFALAKSGRQREAVGPFKEAIRHNPEKIDSYILLADLHLQLAEKNAAIELARLAERLDPKDPRLPTLQRKLQEK